MGRLKLKPYMLQLVTHELMFVQVVLLSKTHSMFSFIMGIAHFEFPSPHVTLKLYSLVVVMLDMTIALFGNLLHQSLHCFRQLLSSSSSGSLVIGALV
jgi:hypothetical protein